MISVRSWLYLNPRTHEQWIAPAGTSEDQIAVFDAGGQHTSLQTDTTSSPRFRLRAA